MRLAVLAYLALAAPVHAADAQRFEAGPSDGKIVVSAYKAGLFSGFAHDHHFTVTRWTATAEIPDGDPARASVAVVLFADSLHDTQKSLSDADRRKVDAQAAGPDVLDAAAHPRIEFSSRRIELAPARPSPGGARGTIHGVLAVRGRTIPLDVPFEAERAAAGWKVRGSVRFKQSSAGIKPFSGFGGTVKVKDELRVEFELTLEPRGDRG